MKKKLLMGLLALGLMTGATSYAQTMDTKSNKKERKATKKMDKGKTHKALKKTVKAEKKEEVGR